jgi:hypothetical protein
MMLEGSNMSQANTIGKLIAQMFDDLVNETDAERFLDRHVEMRELKRDLSLAVRDAENLAAEMLEGVKDADIGKHHVEVRWSKQRRWTDNDALRAAVSRIARFDPETGEERGATDALMIFTEAFRCTGGEARTTWLKKHDIDPDEYSEGDWRASVSITGRSITDE